MHKSVAVVAVLSRRQSILGVLHEIKKNVRGDIVRPSVSDLVSVIKLFVGCSASSLQDATWRLENCGDGPSDGSTVLMDITSLYFPHLLPDFREIPYERASYIGRPVNVAHVA